MPAPTGKTSTPFVVVGTTRDPATPYEWAQHMAQVYSSSRLLTYDGDGHTAFGGRSSCINDAVVAYFLDLKTPEPGKTCR